MTRHLVDPELLPLLDLMPGIDFAQVDLPELRQASNARYAFLGNPPLAPRIETIAGPGAPLELFIYDPAPGTDNRAALLHIHGGGMIMGSARAMQLGPANMARSLGIPVVSVEYRLAPEHPFPTPQEDCYAALCWLAEHADELGLDRQRIGVTGESAGGGLAAAVALMARDRKGPPLAGQFLTYPMLDHRTGGPDCPYGNPVTGEFVWTAAANQFGWAALRGDYRADDACKGWYSPALAEDLARLPPTWIGTGSLDLFLDEDLAYARRLIAAGVPVELHVYPGAIHAFNAVAESRLAKAFGRDLMSAIALGLGVTSQAQP